MGRGPGEFVARAGLFTPLILPARLHLSAQSRTPGVHHCAVAQPPTLSAVSVCDCPGCAAGGLCLWPRPVWSPATLDGVVLPERLVALVQAFDQPRPSDEGRG